MFFSKSASKITPNAEEEEYLRGVAAADHGAVAAAERLWVEEAVAPDQDLEWE